MRLKLRMATRVALLIGLAIVVNIKATSPTSQSNKIHICFIEILASGLVCFKMSQPPITDLFTSSEFYLSFLHLNLFISFSGLSRFILCNRSFKKSSSVWRYAKLQAACHFLSRIEIPRRLKIFIDLVRILFTRVPSRARRGIFSQILIAPLEKPSGLLQCP